MQVLYVVEFSVTPRHAGVDPYRATLDSVTSWLTFLAERDLDGQLLESSGDMALSPNLAGASRTAMWEVAGTDDTKAVRVEIRDDSPDSGAAFVTRVTVGRIGAATTIRVSMARESSPIWLSPAPAADIRQPGIVRSLLENVRIILSIVGQEQDGRYIQVRTDPEVHTLASAIQKPTRLPILLVHTRTLPALATARQVAGKLVGLVRVVTLDYRASRALDAELPGYAPPRAGARLIWSDPSARSITFDDLRVNVDDPDVLRSDLMRLLAPVSVLARGLDHAYREARRAEIVDRDRDARARAEQAAAEGDLVAEAAALRAEVSAARANAEEWQRLATDEEQRADRFQAQAGKVPDLEAQIEQLTIALLAIPPASEQDDTTETDPWDGLPELVSGDSDSAENLILHLEDASSGHIAFTDRAVTTWKKCKYPFSGEMTECLVKLARVAAALYDGAERSYPHLDTWIRDEFDLKVSLQDDTIEKNSKMRYFDYDGATHDRTPHVKVRDHAPPSQVGRIHFALHHEGRRLIVDHVGLKLY
ncbi:hypothetical protein [Oceanitalea stevensii]|uniref:Uncharacterized protein n=1 Tax=Oceanitalea stevensii TaxID=2763072 RepID=A0ABR8Z6F7_9MICO|nr:hypothetical protein [Oceanitalea stevensii]MBD8063752.1 hypothetical protein [Oceanitalea stevensii]